MKNNNLYISILIGILFSGCYTYNVPSGATTPLLTKKGETKVSASMNFNGVGGTYTIALTDHALFSASGNFIFTENDYKQDYDSIFFKKTPNDFEAAFGYYGSRNKFANSLMFGIGTGNTVFHSEQNIDAYIEGYFQTEFVQYFLQYNAGFKYQKKRRKRTKLKESGISLRYAYHDYHLIGISNEHGYEEVWNEETGYYDYYDYVITSKKEQTGFFNSFSIYYFYRTGNDKMQFEISPGLTFYDGRFNYYNHNVLSKRLHFNVGFVFNLNQILKY